MMETEKQNSEMEPESKHETNWVALLLIVIVVAVVAVGLYFWLMPQEETTEIGETEIMPGSDRDEHGCIGSAGYEWCEPKEKCIRPWEEDCE